MKANTYFCRLPAGAVTCKGILRNYNTLDEFKAADKAGPLDHIANQVLFMPVHPILSSFLTLLFYTWAGIMSPEVDEIVFTCFILIAFTDFKKYKYYYCLRIPALVARPAA